MWERVDGMEGLWCVRVEAREGVIGAGSRQRRRILRAQSWRSDVCVCIIFNNTRVQKEIFVGIDERYFGTYLIGILRETALWFTGAAEEREKWRRSVGRGGGVVVQLQLYKRFGIPRRKRLQHAAATLTPALVFPCTLWLIIEDPGTWLDIGCMTGHNIFTFDARTNENHTKRLETKSQIEKCFSDWFAILKCVATCV